MTGSTSRGSPLTGIISSQRGALCGPGSWPCLCQATPLGVPREQRHLDVDRTQPEGSLSSTQPPVQRPCRASMSCAWRGQGCQPQRRVLAQVTFPWRLFTEARGWQAAGALADISGTRVYATLHYKQPSLVAVALWADPQDLGKRVHMTRARGQVMHGWLGSSSWRKEHSPGLGVPQACWTVGLLQRVRGQRRPEDRALRGGVGARLWAQALPLSALVLPSRRWTSSVCLRPGVGVLPDLRCEAGLRPATSLPRVIPVAAWGPGATLCPRKGLCGDKCRVFTELQGSRRCYPGQGRECRAVGRAPHTARVLPLSCTPSTLLNAELPPVLSEQLRGLVMAALAFPASGRQQIQTPLTAEA